EFNTTGEVPVGATGEKPPAPVESGPLTRPRSNVLLPGTYCPAFCGTPRSPPAVGTAALLPATKSGTKMRAPAGNTAYLMRNRVSESAPGARTSKADAKPSVRRVEAKVVPAANRFDRVKLDGEGEPKHAMPVL